MATLPVVLSIDDMNTNHQIIKIALAEQYQVETAMDGLEGLKKAAQLLPDIILLDINMPNLNGYETCFRLKEDETTRNIPVIFISDLSSVDDRLKAYDVGAQNYASKPVDGRELLHQIENLLVMRQNLNTLQDDLQFASDTAVTAMTSIGEMGIVLAFIETTFGCRDTASLAQEMFRTLGIYGIEGCVQIRMKEKVENFSSSPVISPLEKELLDRSQDKRNIVSCNTRTLFNSPAISLLIKDMPISDDDKYGRYKDHLAIMLKGAEASTLHLQDMEKLKNTQASQIDETLIEVQNDLQAVDQQVKEFERQIKHVMDDLFVDLEGTIMTLSLTAEEETLIMAIFEKSRHKLETPFDIGAFIDVSFARISDKIKKLLK